MAETYKAFFKFDEYYWNPIQAFYVRLSGIPEWVLIAEPGLNTNIFKELVEVRSARTLTLSVSKAQAYSQIGKEALDGLKRFQYKIPYYPDRDAKYPSMSMTFAVEKWSGGKITERLWVQDENASVESGPDWHTQLYVEGWNFSLRLPSALLLGNVPPPGS